MSFWLLFNSPSVECQLKPTNLSLHKLTTSMIILCGLIKNNISIYWSSPRQMVQQISYRGHVSVQRRRDHLSSQTKWWWGDNLGSFKPSNHPSAGSLFSDICLVCLLSFGNQFLILDVPVRLQINCAFVMSSIREQKKNKNSFSAYSAHFTGRLTISEWVPNKWNIKFD